LIFEAALNAKASALILVHNHPSGNLKPSKQDIAITAKLKSAGQVLDLPILDHIIIAETGYYSFADEGIL
jgi:DNA repair protein RadC